MDRLEKLEKLQPLARQLVDRYFSNGLSDLTQSEQIFFLLWSYGGQLDNGGHISFFHNSGADNYAETIQALQNSDLAQFAQLLRRAAAVLFAGTVPPTTELRNEAIAGLPDDESIDNELESIDTEFFAMGGGTRVLEALPALISEINRNLRD